MGSRRAAGGKRLEAPLLSLSRDPKRLAGLLQLLLPAAARRAAMQAAGLPARAGAAGDLRMAREIAQHERLRAAAADALARELPRPTDPPAGPDALAEADRDALLAALHGALATGEAETWQLAIDCAEAWAERLAAKPARKPVAKPRSEPARRAPGAAALEAATGRLEQSEQKRKDLRDKLQTAKHDVKELRREISRLEKELGLAHKEARVLGKDLEEERSRAREADQRAAEVKRRLSGATSASEREQELRAQTDDAERRSQVAEQKLRLVIDERDDLRACLEDSVRFRSAEEEEVPSFRDRPLLSKEQDLAEALVAGALRPRILVVGGGEPQLRHLDKFVEYAEVMGFGGEWRLANYESWHKEIDKLAADMRERFDALVILHWNRTTFTRKAREICNQAGQRPCITCHYEGFTSLRETLQECLRQLIEASGAGGRS